jgi:WD40 repeat protein
MAVLGADQIVRLIDPGKLAIAAVCEVQDPVERICGWKESPSRQLWALHEHHRTSDPSHTPHSIAIWRKDETGFHRMTTLPLDAGMVLDVAFTADESEVITYSRESDTSGDLIRVWRVNDGTLRRAIPVPDTHMVMWMDILQDHFRPDLGAVLVRRADESDELHLQLLDMATGELTGKPFTLGWKHGQPNRMRFSPDGIRLASVGFDQMGTIVDLRTGELAVPPFKHGGPLIDVDWSPDGKRLLTAGWGDVRVWDASTGEMFGSPLHGTVSARWSSDGRFILTRGDDNTAVVYDGSTTEPVTPRLRHTGYVRWASVSQGNRLITASDPNLLRAWDLTPTALPADVIADYARLLSGRRLSASGVMLGIPARELAALGQSLWAQHPELFLTPRAGRDD